MSPIKIARAFLRAAVFGGEQTRAHILRNIAPNAAALRDLSSAQLAAVIEVANRSYHDGRAACGGAEIVDGALWVGLDINKLIPLDVMRALRVELTHEDVPRQASGIDPNPLPGSTTRWTIRDYSLQYTERT